MNAAPAQQALPAAVLETGLAQPVTVIRPSRGWISLRPADLWSNRELLYFHPAAPLVPPTPTRPEPRVPSRLFRRPDQVISSLQSPH